MYQMPCELHPDVIDAVDVQVWSASPASTAAMQAQLPGLQALAALPPASTMIAAQDHDRRLEDALWRAQALAAELPHATVQVTRHFPAVRATEVAASTRSKEAAQAFEAREKQRAAKQAGLVLLSNASAMGIGAPC